VSSLAVTRTGSGPPLVLLHGLGSWRGAWDPVLPVLADRFDVLAFDLPGFGDSPPMPADVLPRPAALATAVAEQLDDLGVVSPHVAGNSLGGWVALEFAAIRPIASLTLLSPAGLWHGEIPAYCHVSLRASRWLSCHTFPVLERLVRTRPGRAVVLGQTHGRPTRLTADSARAALAAMRDAPGFDAALRATTDIHYVSRPLSDAPMTIAFGGRDRLLLPRLARRLDQLPCTVRVAGLPGCGHVPMADDPDAVAAIIAGCAMLAR
jgi:pimeloyl-ACP methyl ester carboxylesterase